MHYYIEVLKKYAVFSGRAGRAEYWYFVLFNIIIGFVLGFIEGSNFKGDGPLSNIYHLAVLLPSLGVAIRRMHDVSKSGWFILIPIYNLILALRRGDTGDNKYGAPMNTASNTAEIKTE
ncbi:MAG: DUF805 domain-containing protein [bacterium]|nr:DUF805 domain-containing protein [bacterium]